MNLLIGIGSLVRTDDCLGHHLVQAVGHGWQVITATQLTPELAEPISRAERVIFVDARVGAVPGQVFCEPLEAPVLGAGAFTHHVDAASLLAGARELYGACPPALLIAVTGASFAYGCDLSPQIAALMPQITSQVHHLVANFTLSEGPRANEHPQAKTDD